MSATEKVRREKWIEEKTTKIKVLSDLCVCQLNGLVVAR